MPSVFARVDGQTAHGQMALSLSRFQNIHGHKNSFTFILLPILGFVIVLLADSDETEARISLLFLSKSA